MRTTLPALLIGAALGAACASNPSPAPPERSPAAPSSTSAAASATAATADQPMASGSAVACAPGTHLENGSCVPGEGPTVAASASAKASPCGSGMTLVPGGFYAYGFKKENTRVEPFCMDVTETTAESYAACVKSGKCTDAGMNCAAQSTYGVDALKDHPIVCVDFEQANAYCAAQNKRLPTDEEWEWAARGGDKATKFPWGDDAPKDQLCWAGAGPQKGTCAVGAFKSGASPTGVMDLAGGVFEFTTTKNDDKSPTRVGRGGSWRDGTADAFRANRVGGFARNYRCGFLGIRCVNVPPGLADTGQAARAASASPAVTAPPAASPR